MVRCDAEGGSSCSPCSSSSSPFDRVLVVAVAPSRSRRGRGSGDGVSLTAPFDAGETRSMGQLTRAPSVPRGAGERDSGRASSGHDVNSPVASSLRWSVRRDERR